MCRSKAEGGLGFRELSTFNQALLTKQSWRILRDPTNLLAKTLRGKYFKDENFLQANLGSNLSLTWKNILWGRDIFVKRFIWKVGNEKYIEIDKNLFYLIEKIIAYLQAQMTVSKG